MLYMTHPETGEKLDDVSIRYQFLTFLVAGHETTAGALSFALYYLVRNPHVLTCAQAEVDSFLGDDVDTEPTFDQVAKFRYVRRVLDETLRLWPTVPGFTRRPRADTMLGGRWPMRTEDRAVVLTADHDVRGFPSDPHPAGPVAARRRRVGGACRTGQRMSISFLLEWI